MNRSFTVDAPTCHIQRDSGSNHIVVASYHGGRIALVALTTDGRIGEQLDVQQHEGHGPNAERQEKPHPHSVFFSPDERYLFVPDLGIDRIRAYTIDKERGKLQFNGETAAQPGAGPRHMAFHPNGKFALSSMSLDSSITSYHYDADQGSCIRLRQCRRFLPASTGRIRVRRLRYRRTEPICTARTAVMTASPSMRSTRRQER